MEIVQPKYEKYSLSTDRNLTFGEFWSDNLPIETNTLVMEGLFYTGKSDWVVCYSCGSGFKNLTKKDNLLFIHVKTFPECHFIRKSRCFTSIQSLLNQARGIVTFGKVFVPKESDFISVLHIEMKSMSNKLSLLKKCFRQSMNGAKQTIDTLKTTIQNHRRNLAILSAEKVTLNNQLETFNRRLECSICQDREVNMTTNCLHFFCNICITRITLCAICRLPIETRRGIFL